MVMRIALRRKSNYLRRSTVCLTTLLALAGCGGGSHLPRPRPAEDDEPVAVAPTAPQGGPANPGSPQPGASSPTVGTIAPAGSNAATPNGPAAAAGGPASTDAQAILARRRQAVANLHKIGGALEKYRGKHARYPDQVIVGRDGLWLLSWRVALLPFLGHEELYGRFKLDQPWNGPDNKALLDQIPEVFRSPERNDQSTCIQLITGAKTAYEIPAGLADRTCRDGLINTMFVAEVHPELSRPWTQPEDYLLTPARVHQDLFTHRLDGALVIFGGDVGPRLLPANVSDEKLLAVLTPNGKEPVDGERVSRELQAEPYSDIVESLQKAPITRQFGNLISAPAGAAKPEGVAAAAAVVAPEPRVVAGESDEDSAPPAAEVASSDGRAAIPTEALLTAAGEEVRKLYADEYKTAKKAEDRKQFAKKLFEESKQVEADPPALFVMLRAARDIAAPTGDLDLALDAQAKLLEFFQVDEFPTTLKVLEQCSPQLKDSSAVGKLYDEAMRLADLALEHDDFAGAKQALNMAQSAARRSQNQEALAAANRREDEVNASRFAFQKIAPHLHTILRSPEQPTANGAVGRYTSLVKRDWEKGLGMLAKGDDQPLRKLAQDDLGDPRDHETQAVLGDAWWEWSEQASSPIEKSSAKQRAIHWYKQALPGLQPSLSRVRAERRVAEIESPAKSRPNLR